jgi:hypothetical protein
MLTRWLGPASMVLLGLVAVLQVLALSPPAALSTAAPATEFSASRALVHVRSIAATPRPVGSPAHEAARETIERVLRSQGLEPEEQRTVWAGTRYGVPFPVADVRNFVARLPGRDNTKAVALVAHYDSVRVAPGAADDGSGVAALLETLRALRAGPPLRNDVLFVFTDAEELGMVGAEAFVAENPWTRGIGVVLNLEARGVRGPALMFETSPGNGRLIDAFGDAPHPVSSSVFYDVAKRLGHGTDFVVFKDAGIPGLNFALDDGVACYHTPCDDLAHLDPDSLQHLGEQALALARHFGNADLRDLGDGDAAWFDAVGTWLVSYPASWVTPIGVLVLLAFAGVVVLGLRKRVLRPLPALGGFAAFLVAVGVTAGLSWLLWLALHALHSGLNLMRAGDPYDPGLYRLGFVLLAAALSSTSHALARTRLEVLDLAVGAAFGWLLLLGFATIAVPAGAHLFAWPLLFELGALALLFAHGRPEPTNPLEIGVAAVAALPAVLILAPMVALLYPALGLSGVAVPAAVIAAGIGLLLPVLAWLVAREGRWARLLLVLGATGVLVAAGVTNRYGEGRPVPTSLAYALDATNARAWWLSDGPELDPWAGAFIPADTQLAVLPEFSAEDVEVRKAPAPKIDLAAPQLALLEDRTAGGTRSLRFSVTSVRHAPIVHVIVPHSTVVTGAIVGRRRIPPSLVRSPLPDGFQWGFSFFGPPDGTFEWTLETTTTATGSATVVVVDQSSGVPPEPGPSHRMRPKEAVAARSWLADTTLVRAEFRF